MGRKPVPCPSCGELYGGQGKVCISCYLKQQEEKRKISQTCPECGGYKHRQSRLCQTCHLKSVATPEHYITKECPVCGKEFIRHKAQKAKYCSRSCARSGSPTKKRTRLILTCTFCGTEFEKHKSEIRKTKGENHFCSQECWFAYNQGENHYGYTGTTPERQAFYSSREWKQAAKAIWKRDKAQCQRCGIKKEFYSGQFHIHHIVSFTVEYLRAELGNLVLLCQDCHVWVHSNQNQEKDWLGETEQT
jgi:hypothetical protein